MADLSALPREADAEAGTAKVPVRLLELSEEAARQLDVCVHCGFCLAVCPTYRELGEEADSPRGRIDIMAAAHTGQVSLDEAEVGQHLDRCLDCRACETACPSGVRYHLLLESAMAQLPSRRPWTASATGEEARSYAQASRLIHLGLGRILTSPWLLSTAVRLAHLAGPLTGLLPRGVRELMAGLPTPAQRPARGQLPLVLPAVGPRRGAVDLFLGCVQDAVLGGDNAAAARVLAACGYDVHVIRGQTCCGALHVHSGARQALAALAATNMRTLGQDGRPVVVGAAGCGAVLKEYPELLEGTPQAEAASRFGPQVFDFSEFLVRVPELPLAHTPRGAPPRVTYHDPCHLAHAQGVRRQPRDLIAAVPGIEYVELAEADSCCGSAGIYNLVQPKLAGQVLDRKLENLRASGAGWVVTANPGCALQLRGGIARAGLEMRVLSLAEFLDLAYGGEA